MMRLKIFDIMEEHGWVGDILIDESQGFPDVIISSMDEKRGDRLEEHMKFTDPDWRAIMNDFTEADLLYLRSIIDEKL